MVTELEHKILLWGASSYNGSRGKTRKEFNDSVKNTLGEEANRVTLRLWKESYLKLGNLGLVTISLKGCLKVTEDLEEKKQ